MSDAIVIGGGLVGASAAYRLARARIRVTVVDRADPGQATAAGAGIICPATSLKAPPAFFPLACEAVGYYPRMLAELADDGERETGHETVGALFVATSDEEAARVPGVLSMIEQQRAAGMPNVGEVSRLDARGARELFPALREVHAAIFLSAAARVNGRSLRDALLRAAQKRGAAVIRGSAELVRDRDRVTGVNVDGRFVATGAVIIAGGAWSNTLGESLGLKLPVYPQRGQILHLDMPGTDTSRWPIVEGFHSHYVLAFPNHRVVAGATREDESGYDYRLTAGGVHEALSEALRLAPGLTRATLHEVRIGLRPASPDHLPILGRAPGVRNAYIATGHGPYGLQLGPYSGAAVADLIQGNPVAADLAPCAAERFQ